MNALPKTLDDVLNELNAIVKNSMVQNHRGGLFAYVYYRTTLEIKRAIEAGEFENSQRMEDFDVVFANLYLKAYYNYKAKQPVSQVWQMAFVADQSKLSVLQHIMLGMNAHINLDLGIAAHDIMKGKDISKLKSDFIKVNEILASLIAELQERLSRISPLLFLLDWLGHQKDEQIINFSMIKARQYAWHLAQDLSTFESIHNKERLKAADDLATKLSKGIINPPGYIIPNILRLIQFFESKDVSKTINIIRW